MPISWLVTPTTRALSSPVYQWLPARTDRRVAHLSLHSPELRNRAGDRRLGFERQGLQFCRLGSSKSLAVASTRLFVPVHRTARHWSSKVAGALPAYPLLDGDRSDERHSIFGYRHKGRWFGWTHEAGLYLLMPKPFQLEIPINSFPNLHRVLSRAYRAEFCRLSFIRTDNFGRSKDASCKLKLAN